MFRIGDICGFPSGKVNGKWAIECASTGHLFHLEITIHTGKKDGVRILLATGPEYQSAIASRAIREISDSIDNSSFNGVLICAFDFAEFIGQFKKPNEPLFPGWPEGDDGECVAWQIFQELLNQVDYAIFLDGPDPNFTSIPHASIYSIDDPPTMSCHPELIKMMGNDLILEKKGEKGSLAIEAQREYALPVLISQTDEVDSSEKMLNWTKEKALNFLSFAGLIPELATIPNRTFIAARTGEVRSEFDGNMNLHVELHDFISEGEQVGSIRIEKNNKHFDLENEESGYVVRRRNSGNVLVDDLMYSLLEVRFKYLHSSILWCETIIDNTEMLDVTLRENELFLRLNRE